MAKKVGKGLIALSSAAIVSVYGIGYAVTQPAAVSMAAGSAPAAPASPEASAAPTTAAGMKDGAYSGTGWSRHGSVSVSVTVQGGRIVSAPITGVTTRYSQSVIAGLPAKVVSAQSSRVDLVSGATDSSDAYVSAVSQALAQAGGSASTSAASGAQSDATGVQLGSDGATGQPATNVGRGGSVTVTGPNGSTIYRNPSGRRHRGGYGYYGQ